MSERIIFRRVVNTVCGRVEMNEYVLASSKEDAERVLSWNGLSGEAVPTDLSLNNFNGVLMVTD